MEANYPGIGEILSVGGTIAAFDSDMTSTPEPASGAIDLMFPFGGPFGASDFLLGASPFIDYTRIVNYRGTDPGEGAPFDIVTSQRDDMVTPREPIPLGTLFINTQGLYTDGISPEPPPRILALLANCPPDPLTGPSLTTRLPNQSSRVPHRSAGEFSGLKGTGRAPIGSLHEPLHLSECGGGFHGSRPLDYMRSAAFLDYLKRPSCLMTQAQIALAVGDTERGVTRALSAIHRSLMTGGRNVPFAQQAAELVANNTKPIDIAHTYAERVRAWDSTRAWDVHDLSPLAADHMDAYRDNAARDIAKHAETNGTDGLRKTLSHAWYAFKRNNRLHNQLTQA